jgi:hypothetical protein
MRQEPDPVPGLKILSVLYNYIIRSGRSAALRRRLLCENDHRWMRPREVRHKARQVHELTGSASEDRRLDGRANFLWRHRKTGWPGDEAARE